MGIGRATDYLRNIVEDTSPQLGANLDGQAFDISTTGTIVGINITSGADPGHTHTGASLSGIDISDDTNLAVTSPIVLTDDTLSLDQSAVDHGSIGGLGDDDHTHYLLADGTRDLSGNWTIATNNITLTNGTITAEQLTSTDDITMQGHLFTMGDDSAVTDSVMSFKSSGNDGSITFDQSDNEFDFGVANLKTTGTITIDSGNNGLILGTSEEAFIFYDIDSNSLVIQANFLTASDDIIFACDKFTHEDGTFDLDSDNLTTTGTVTAEQLTSTDDALITNILSFLAGDGTIQHDGDSLNIVANAVTPGDSLNITANDIDITLNTGQLFLIRETHSPIVRLLTTKSDGSWITDGADFGKLEFFSSDSSGPGAGIRASILVTPQTNSGSTTKMIFSVADAATNENPVMVIFDKGVSIGSIAIPFNSLQINHEGGDRDNGIMVVKDAATSSGDLLGGLGFDSTDGAVPSTILEASAFIAAYASENHSAQDKGGELAFGTTITNENDDTLSHEWLRLRNEGTLSLITDSQKLTFGAAQDVYVEFDGEDMIIASANVTANDELHINDFDAMVLKTTTKLNFLDPAIGIYSPADTFLDLFADGAVRIGDSSGGAPTNYANFNSTGNLSFVGSAGITGLKIGTTNKTTGYTATLTDDFISADASGGAFTITLPAVATATGKVYYIKKIDATGNPITIDGNGAETIDGAATAIINAQYESITLICNGSTWYIN